MDTAAKHGGKRNWQRLGAITRRIVKRFQTDTGTPAREAQPARNGERFDTLKLPSRVTGKSEPVGADTLEQVVK